MRYSPIPNAPLTPLAQAIIPNLAIKQSEHTLLEQAKTTAEKAAALAPFLLNNREAVVRPTIEKFFQAIRADPHTYVRAGLGSGLGRRTWEMGDGN
jgi:hypothetical protein